MNGPSGRNSLVLQSMKHNLRGFKQIVDSSGVDSENEG